MDVGGGGGPPMRPGVVGGRHRTRNLDFVLKKKDRRYSYAGAVSGVVDCRRPDVDDGRRPSVDDCNRSIVVEIRRLDSTEFC